MTFCDLLKKLRKDGTKAEKLFWDHVKNRKFNGKKFLRQHPIHFKLEDTRRCFIADFYCAEHKLIIEIDGKVHDNQKEYDEYRSYALNNFGFKVIRFKNEEILDNINTVLAKIEFYIQNS